MQLSMEIVVGDFFQFSSAIARFLLLYRRPGIRLCMQPILRFSRNFLGF